MKYPEFLKENGKIGFVAPSFGNSTEPYKSAFDNSLKAWKSLGYETILGPNCYEGSGVGISNKPSICADELMEYYESLGNDILISCGGGELMCETMSFVDFDRIKDAPPKWYLGYSDNTNMSFLLATICDVASIYGPCAGTFGMREWHKSLKDTYDVFTGRKFVVENYDKYEVESLKNEDNPLEPYNCTEPVNIKAYKGGEYVDCINMKGRLLGGCLDILTNITGTRFDNVDAFLEKYKEDGIIWFIEACDLNVFSIRRAMWQLKESGWFKYVKGFICGRPRCGEAFMGLDEYQAVIPTVESLGDIPVIFDADIGHVAPSMPIICGALSEVTFDKGHLVIDMGIEI